jgi:myo-inositol 2-dehydrogenase/D-chiro-inositol 1-dehydrogenase
MRVLCLVVAAAVGVVDVSGFANLGVPTTLSARRSVLSMAAESTDTTKNIKVGVIGCGRIGIVHLGAITKAPNVTPVIVSNPTVSKAEKAAADFGVPRFTADAMDVITDPEVDAVWICSPSQFHADQIKACAANGKHIFCEKPIATDLAETVEAINACNAAGVKLMIGLQRRFDQNFLRVKDAILTEEVGTPIMIKLCSRDPSPPPFEYVKGGGGIFNDMAVHDLDMTRFLAGTDPIDILSIGSCHIDKSIEVLPGSEKYDTACCIVRYPNGVQAMVDVCRQSSYGYDQRAEVLGTEGMISTDNVYPNTAKIFKNQFTGNADMPYDFFLSRYNEAYVTETVAFCQSLVNDTPVPCTGEDGLVALIMSIAADKSAAENRWVKFSEIVADVYCSSPTECELLSQSEVFPENFKPTEDASSLLIPDVDQQKAEPNSLKKFTDAFKDFVGA